MNTQQSNLIEWPADDLYTDLDRTILNTLTYEQRMNWITLRTRFNAEQLGVKLDQSVSEVPFTSRAPLAQGITSR